MRSSRRNKDLRPEFTLEPTPPSSEGSNFTSNLQIETTLEEEERYRREENENVDLLSRNEVESVHDLDSTGKDVGKDIVFSSAKSTDDDSDSDEAIVIEKKTLEKKSST